METCFKVTNITIEIDSEYSECVPEARSPIRNRESVKHLEEEARKLWLSENKDKMKYLQSTTEWGRVS